MDPRTHCKACLRRWTRPGRLEPMKVIALLVLAIVPGGLVLPVCYAAYGAIRRSLPVRLVRRSV